MPNRTYSVPITFFVDMKLKRKLQRAAKKAGISNSELLRQMIDGL